MMAPADGADKADLAFPGGAPRPGAPTLTTARLRLRPWTWEDRPAWLELHADPDIIYWLGGLTRQASELSFERAARRFETADFGVYAVETLDGRLIGAAGLQPAPAGLVSATPVVEAAWRLRRDARGQGYVTEAMQAALADGFERVGLEEVVAFTAYTNHRSQSVMRRLGFTRSGGEDFDHPALPQGHPLRRHVVFRLKRPE